MFNFTKKVLLTPSAPRPPFIRWLMIKLFSCATISRVGGFNQVRSSPGLPQVLDVNLLSAFQSVVQLLHSENLSRCLIIQQAKLQYIALTNSSQLLGLSLSCVAVITLDNLTILHPYFNYFSNWSFKDSGYCSELTIQLIK